MAVNNISPSSWVFNFIKTIEQLRLTAYKPTPNDVWTIGWGHTHGVKEGDICTVTTAMGWLDADLAGAVREINGLVTAPLSQCQFDALVSLVYNIGGAAFATSTLLRVLNAGDYESAANEFLRWDHQAGVELAGLLTRRTHERERFIEAA